MAMLDLRLLLLATSNFSSDAGPASCDTGQARSFPDNDFRNQLPPAVRSRMSPLARYLLALDDELE